VSNCQINAVVPLEVAPGFPTFVTVQSGGQTLGPMKLPVVVAAPGVFTVGASGQAAILNQDSSLNSSTNPAASGSIVSIYMTGTGALNPSIADGSLGPLTAPFPMVAAGVSAVIGGVDAPVVFAGQAPGFVVGLTQVNVQVPQNAPAGAAVPIAIYVGGYYSGATLAVQ
jgi:uncharacterized protein (TIGR03437 family)